MVKNGPERILGYLYIAGSDLIPELRKDEAKSKKNNVAGSIHCPRRYYHAIASATRVARWDLNPKPNGDISRDLHFYQTGEKNG